jgi:polyisoprenoid-binding protein YceI
MAIAKQYPTLQFIFYNQKKTIMSTTKWALDNAHSEIQFKVRHLMVSWANGNFKKFNAEVRSSGEDFTTARVKFTADVESINTNNEQRDAHLKTGDFFDAANHPQIAFESESWEKIADDEFKLHGLLTMRGVTKKVALRVEFGGVMQDPWGNTRTGFTVSGKINRKDFGVSFGGVSETGNVLLGDDVTINANVEFVKVNELQRA